MSAWLGFRTHVLFIRALDAERAPNVKRAECRCGWLGHYTLDEQVLRNQYRAHAESRELPEAGAL